jgi:hypothetical protein
MKNIFFKDTAHEIESRGIENEMSVDAKTSENKKQDMAETIETT